MKVLVAPDKFRGSAGAAEVASAMAAGAVAAGCDEVRELPLSDGGEGFADVLVNSCGGSYESCDANDSNGDPISVDYGVLPDGTAVIESASAIGLDRVRGRRHDPVLASTSGVGELIHDAIEKGASKILVGIGGSATSDGGMGAVEELNWSLNGVEVLVACDVSTAFVDAARVFGPQKGASPTQVEILTERLSRHRSDFLHKTGIDVNLIAGSGAGGGLAGGLAAIGARLVPGFGIVAGYAGLARHLDACDLVMTGEGRLDATSLSGKVVGEVLARAVRQGVDRRLVIAGQVVREQVDALALMDEELAVLAEIAPTVDDAMTRALELIEVISENRTRELLRRMA